MSGKFKSLPWRNYSLMFISLAMAVVMWIYVNNLENPLQEKVFRLSLTPINLPNGMVIEQIPERISIKVQTNNVPGGLSAEDFKATVDLANVRLGSNTLPVQVTGPHRVKITQINPEQVNVVVDKLAQKQLPVELVIKGSPQAGFSLGEPTLIPNSVLASGPGRVLDNIAKVPVTLDVTGADQDIDYSLPLTVRGDVQLAPSVVRVVVPINVTTPYKSVPVHVNTTGSPAEGFEVADITANPSTVTVYAPAELLNQITGVTTKSLNLSGIESNVKRPVELQLPNGAVLLQPNTVEVTVTVNKRPEPEEKPEPSPTDEQAPQTSS